jgi:hypothetical protein
VPTFARIEDRTQQAARLIMLESKPDFISIVTEGDFLRRAETGTQGPCRAMAVGAQISLFGRCRHYFRADQWRAQCRGSLRAGPPEPTFPYGFAPTRRAICRPRYLADYELAAGGFLVASLERMACRKIRSASTAASAGSNRWQICAAGGRTRPLCADEIKEAARLRLRSGVCCF